MVRGLVVMVIVGVGDFMCDQVWVRNWWVWWSPHDEGFEGGDCLQFIRSRSGFALNSLL